VSSAHRISSPRTLVVGCGAIGGVLAGSLAAKGVPPELLTKNAAIAAAVRERGIIVQGVGGQRVGAAAAVHERLSGGVPAFELVVLATQPPEVEVAAETVLPWLREDGRIVCLQNGLCEERVARIAGSERTIGAVVAWGASMERPGVYVQTARGPMTLGRLQEPPDAALRRVAALFGRAFPVSTTENLRGVRWSKLAVNAAISTLGTIGGVPLGQLLSSRRARRLALEIVTEVLTVARREAVTLEPVARTLNLEVLDLGPAVCRRSFGVQLALKHALVFGMALPYRRMRSSMLSAIQRGRTPAIDFLNGEVVARAHRHGMEVPVNERATEWVWQIARGERSPGAASLVALYEATSR